MPYYFLDKLITKLVMAIIRANNEIIVEENSILLLLFFASLKLSITHPVNQNQTTKNPIGPKIDNKINNILFIYLFQ